MKKLLSRILIELDTPLHAGGGEAGVMTDQPVVRDCFGWYMIPGASLAGVLRQHLEATDGPDAANKLFGWGAEPGKENSGEGSRISISNACLVDLKGHVARELELEGNPVNFKIGTTVRDHVCIDPASGTATKGGKFDIELVPPRTRFAFEMSLNCEGLSEKEEEKTLRQQYFSLLAAMKSRKIQVGGGRTRGLGWFSLCDESKTKEFDLKDKEGLKAWLNLSRGLMFEDDDKDKGVQVDLPEDSPDKEPGAFTGRVKMQLKSIGPLLIGGGSLDAEADLTFYSMTVPDYDKKDTYRAYMIPATSVKGVIRSRIYKILQYRKTEKSDEIINSLFGKIGGKTDGEQAAVGKVRIKDIMLDNSAKAVNVQHVAIDRLTGGALDGALYAEAPVWTDKLEITLDIEFDGLVKEEAELLIHALMDLAEGDLAIGAGGNRGNGRFKLKGDAEVFKQWAEKVSKELNSPEVINNG